MSNKVIGTLKDSGMSYLRIASLIFDRPLLIRQQELTTVLHYLEPRMGFTVVVDSEEETRTASKLETSEPSQFEYRRSEAGYKVYGDTAVIDVMGKLIHRGGFMDSLSGMCSYQSIERQSERALKDPAIEKIFYVHDTPGGEVAGAFDTAEYIREVSKKKQTTAIVSELSASGGFLLAAPTGDIVIARTGEVGSVGVVTAHMDMSEAIKKSGRVMTLVYAGKHKVDGNPYNALPEDVQREMQRQIDATYGMFVQAVSGYLGIEEKKVRDTEARVYRGSEAVDIGFAHRIGTLSTELRAQRKGGRTTRPKQEGKKMTDKDDNQTATEARDAGRAEGLKTGVSDERKRISQITSSEHAKGRTDLAHHLAFETDMTAEAAISILQKSPSEAAKPEAAKPDPVKEKESALDRHMSKVEQPNVGDGGPKNEMSKDDRERKEALAKSIASYHDSKET